MKDKILFLVIGALVGAIITASGFLVYEKINSNTNNMPNAEGTKMMERSDEETPPEKPSDSKDSSNTENSSNKQKPSSKNNSSENKTTNKTEE